MPGGKRTVGAAAALAVFALPVASFAFDWRLFSGSFVLLGYALVGAGGLISLLNLYLSFVRPMVLRRTGGTEEEAQRHLSGIPMLGMLVLPGLLLAPPSALLSALVLVSVAADTNNVAWFVWATWHDDGLWGQRDDE